MIVKVDHREKPDFKETLKKGIEGADVVEMDLPIGDVMLELADRALLIERKTAGDFVSSIGDGRLYRGVKEMSKLTDRFTCMVWVEKSQDIAQEMGYRRMPYYRVLSTELWMAKKGVFVLKMFRSSDFVYLLNREIAKATEGKDEMGSLALEVKMVNAYRGGNLRAEAVSMICSSKGMGPKSAVKLMRGKRVIDVLNQVLTDDMGLTKPQRERIREVLTYVEPHEEGEG